MSEMKKEVKIGMLFNNTSYTLLKSLSQELNVSKKEVLSNALTIYYEWLVAVANNITNTLDK